MIPGRVLMNGPKTVTATWRTDATLLYQTILGICLAAAVIVAPLERAREFTATPIRVLASAQASDTITLHDRRDISTLDATVAAGQRAFNMAKLAHKDIDMVEVHDCFSIAEIMAYEDLGFCKKGEGGKLIEEQRTYIGGKIPVNVSGGLKAKGHPIGATGVVPVSCSHVPDVLA
jgi:acetyl-CoA C-acetyltransferase